MTTTQSFEKIFNKTNGKCYYCKKQLPPDTEYLDDGGKSVAFRRNWHIEHFIPKSRGGSNKIENLVPSCIRCNFKKGTQTADEFLGINKKPYILSAVEIEAAAIYKNAQSIRSAL